jgi:hypothetical protein
VVHSTACRKLVPAQLMPTMTPDEVTSLASSKPHGGWTASRGRGCGPVRAVQ